MDNENFIYTEELDIELQDMIDYEMAIHGDIDTSTVDGQLREIRGLNLYIQMA
jgi:hypothetical protein